MGGVAGSQAVLIGSVLNYSSKLHFGSYVGEVPAAACEVRPSCLGQRDNVLHDGRNQIRIAVGLVGRDLGLEADAGNGARRRFNDLVDNRAVGFEGLALEIHRSRYAALVFGLGTFSVAIINCSKEPAVFRVVLKVGSP